MVTLTNLFIADAIREEKNGKLLFIGVYADVRLSEKPDPADVYVYLTLEDMDVGTHNLEIQIADRTLKRAAGGPAMEITVEDPEETQIQIVQLPQFEFPSSGVYSLIVKFNGVQVGRNDFRLTFPTEGQLDSDE